MYDNTLGTQIMVSNGGSFLPTSYRSQGDDDDPAVTLLSRSPSSSSLKSSDGSKKDKDKKRGVVRSVSFNEAGPAIQRIDSVVNLLAQEQEAQKGAAVTDDDLQASINEIWYDQVEIETSKQESAQLVLELDQPLPPHIQPPQDETLRGLERQTEEGSWQAFQNRNKALEAVLDTPSQDANEIASLASEATEDAKKVAQERALQDEREAEEYLRDVRNSLLDGSIHSLLGTGMGGVSSIHSMPILSRNISDLGLETDDDDDDATFASEGLMDDESITLEALENVPEDDHQDNKKRRGSKSSHDPPSVIATKKKKDKAPSPKPKVQRVKSLPNAKSAVQDDTAAKEDSEEGLPVSPFAAGAKKLREARKRLSAETKESSDRSIPKTSTSSLPTSLNRGKKDDKPLMEDSSSDSSGSSSSNSSSSEEDDWTAMGKSDSGLGFMGVVDGQGKLNEHVKADQARGSIRDRIAKMNDNPQPPPFSFAKKKKKTKTLPSIAPPPKVVRSQSLGAPKKSKAAMTSLLAKHDHDDDDNDAIEDPYMDMSSSDSNLLFAAVGQKSDSNLLFEANTKKKERRASDVKQLTAKLNQVGSPPPFATAKKIKSKKDKKKQQKDMMPTTGVQRCKSMPMPGARAPSAADEIAALLSDVSDADAFMDDSSRLQQNPRRRRTSIKDRVSKMNENPAPVPEGFNAASKKKKSKVKDEDVPPLEAATKVKKSKRASKKESLVVEPTKELLAAGVDLSDNDDESAATASSRVKKSIKDNDAQEASATTTKVKKSKRASKRDIIPPPTKDLIADLSDEEPSSPVKAVDENVAPAKSKAKTSSDDDDNAKNAEYQWEDHAEQREDKDSTDDTTTTKATTKKKASSSDDTDDDDKPDANWAQSLKEKEEAKLKAKKAKLEALKAKRQADPDAVVPDEPVVLRKLPGEKDINIDPSMLPRRKRKTSKPRLSKSKSVDGLEDPDALSRPKGATKTKTSPRRSKSLNKKQALEMLADANLGEDSKKVGPKRSKSLGKKEAAAALQEVKAAVKRKKAAAAPKDGLNGGLALFVKKTQEIEQKQQEAAKQAEESSDSSSDDDNASKKSGGSGKDLAATKKKKEKVKKKSKQEKPSDSDGSDSESDAYTPPRRNTLAGGLASLVLTDFSASENDKEAAPKQRASTMGVALSKGKKVAPMPTEESEAPAKRAAPPRSKSASKKALLPSNSSRSMSSGSGTRKLPDRSSSMGNPAAARRNKFPSNGKRGSVQRIPRRKGAAADAEKEAVTRTNSSVN